MQRMCAGARDTSTAAQNSANTHKQQHMSNNMANLQVKRKGHPSMTSLRVYHCPSINPSICVRVLVKLDVTGFLISTGDLFNAPFATLRVVSLHMLAGVAFLSQLSFGSERGLTASRLCSTLRVDITVSLPDSGLISCRGCHSLSDSWHCVLTTWRTEKPFKVSFRGCAYQARESDTVCLHPAKSTRHHKSPLDTPKTPQRPNQYTCLPRRAAKRSFTPLSGP